MRKILTYLFFIVASLLVIGLFVTAKNYTQLAIAVLLYPAIAYFALRIFPRKPKVVVQLPVKTQAAKVSEVRAEVETQDVLDLDKRTFLKLVGATGIFFFLSSLAGKWIGTLPFGRAINPSTSTSGGFSNSGNQAGSVPTSGYQISEVDDGIVTYYGFINREGAWLIMREDTDTSSFRYAKGGSDFPSSWANRETLKYDYYYNLF